MFSLPHRTTKFLWLEGILLSSTSNPSREVGKVCPECLKLSLRRQTGLFGRQELEVWKSCSRICAHIMAIMLCHIYSVFFCTSGMNSDFSDFSMLSILATISFCIVVWIPLVQKKMNIWPLFCFTAKFWLHYSNRLVGLFIYLLNNHLLGSSVCCWWTAVQLPSTTN